MTLPKAAKTNTKTRRMKQIHNKKKQTVTKPMDDSISETISFVIKGKLTPIKPSFITKKRNVTNKQIKGNLQKIKKEALEECVVKNTAKSKKYKKEQEIKQEIETDEKNTKKTLVKSQKKETLPTAAEIKATVKNIKKEPEDTKPNSQTKKELAATLKKETNIGAKKETFTKKDAHSSVKKESNVPELPISVVDEVAKAIKKETLTRKVYTKKQKAPQKNTVIKSVKKSPLQFVQKKQPNCDVARKPKVSAKNKVKPKSGKSESTDSNEPLAKENAKKKQVPRETSAVKKKQNESREPSPAKKKHHNSREASPTKKKQSISSRETSPAKKKDEYKEVLKKRQSEKVISTKQTAGSREASPVKKKQETKKIEKQKVNKTKDKIFASKKNIKSESSGMDTEDDANDLPADDCNVKTKIDQKQIKKVKVKEEVDSEVEEMKKSKPILKQKPKMILKSTGKQKAQQMLRKKLDPKNSMKNKKNIVVVKKKVLAHGNDKVKSKMTQRARKMKLFGLWNAPKRHRVASLNAIAKVHCLYENEYRGNLLDSIETSKKEGNKIVLQEKETVERDESPPPTRTLRSVPGLRAVGKHWDMHDSTSSSSEDENEINSDDKDSQGKKKCDKEESVKKPPVKRRRNRTEIIMDLKDMVVRKRMASLNASAILAASYSLEKRAVRSPKVEAESDSTDDTDSSYLREPDKKKCFDEDAQQEEERKLIEVRTTPNKKVAVILNQDTDVTITGVYVNSTTRSTHHEGYCSIAGMQYRISATSHTQTNATAVSTETILQSASSSSQENVSEINYLLIAFV